MRIAFVGKGGSGKTTFSGLFSEFISSKSENILSIDADINIHLPSLILGYDKLFPDEKYLSNTKNIKIIKKHLIKNNDRIKSLDNFRKTTPPAKGSHIFDLKNLEDTLYKDFSIKKNFINLMVVGTYSKENIGASCYHNNLSILENILTHMDDTNGICCVDMVAGVDAFASSLYNQFDIIILVVEPTRKSIGIRKDYSDLAKQGGIFDKLFVCANKIYLDEDYKFIEKNIPSEKIIGSLGASKYLKSIEYDGSPLDFSKLEEVNKDCFSKIYNKLKQKTCYPGERLKNLYKMHKKYVSQDFITERFGDLTNQIDESFKF